jgi:hypothetical protein
MSTRREWPASNDVRTWAVEQIGAEPDASVAECRAAVLRALPDDDFVPFDTLKPAAQLVTSKPGTAASAAARDGYLADVETSLRIRIDEFAAEYFNLDIAERRQRYRQLQDLAAPLPALRSRMRRLEWGLDITDHPSADLRGNSAVLCNDLCELFTLAPLPAIARRQELQAQWSLEPDRWQCAAEALVEFAPAVAALQEPLIERLRLGSKLREREAKARRRAALARAERAGAAATSSGDSTPNAGRYGWVIVLVVLGLLKLFVALGNRRDSTPSYTPPPSIRIPDVNKYKDLNLPEKHDNEELKKLLEKLRKNREKLEEIGKRQEKEKAPLKKDQEGGSP